MISISNALILLLGSFATVALAHENCTLAVGNMVSEENYGGILVNGVNYIYVVKPDCVYDGTEFDLYIEAIDAKPHCSIAGTLTGGLHHAIYIFNRADYLGGQTGEHYGLTVTCGAPDYAGPPSVGSGRNDTV
ncbi:hypothetical protein BD324DRAFT_621538 [Kockovaella imperatae]|uniref:AA1-like domain-containing protein n=1 Tax=Kockovaella imperatae TaxID=4999 RepID=A0A1Y1UKV2_9TREE|nr:hypothetical protein BD324DRAFT_621538 [Kockovaella imperatae]ORX38602.1 hypothetical protein BD324DRAFT_621538 [Kockovaella imperatae]